MNNASAYLEPRLHIDHAISLSLHTTLSLNVAALSSTEASVYRDIMVGFIERPTRNLRKSTYLPKNMCGPADNQTDLQMKETDTYKVMHIIANREFLKTFTRHFEVGLSPEKQ